MPMYGDLCIFLPVSLMSIYGDLCICQYEIRQLSSNLGMAELGTPYMLIHKHCMMLQYTQVHIHVS